ncbi:coiled-coil domain-containing protein 181 [Stigmatopora nigra]
MSEVACQKSGEEYEDDFEKDLDWLISEESRAEAQGPEYEDIEADIDKELANDEKQQEEKKGNNNWSKQEDDDERWPTPMDPLEYDSDGDGLNKSFQTTPHPLGVGEETEDEKKYVLDKIQRANKELRGQDAPDLRRRRRLQFKESLVTLVVPPPMTFENDAGEMEVAGRLSELKLSPRGDDTGHKKDDGPKDGRILVEKDGRFDLVSLKEVENQSLLPPIVQYHSGKSSTSTFSSCYSSRTSPSFQKSEPLQTPRPPLRPRSACQSYRGVLRRGTKRRVQSASGTLSQPTFKLSLQQKELLQKGQERKEKMAREAEQRRLEEEEQKRNDNELAFKAWLMKKREQLQHEKRIQRAQEMERMNSQRDSSVAEEAFRQWLRRKQEQQQREKEVVQLRKLEEDCGYLMHSREECERAFKLWLTRKRAEKRAEQQAARERSRRFAQEERRARRMRELLCIASDTRAFRFTDQLTCHY